METPKKTFSRQLKFGANATLYTLFVLGILVFIELISANHHHRIDTTKTGRHSLSPQSLKVLASLQKEIAITSFFGERQGEERDAFKELMEQYAYASHKIRYRNVDPDRNPGETKRYKVTTYGTVVLEQGEAEHRISEHTEGKVTNALIKITREGKKKIVFLSGHGEKEINALKEDGFQSAREALEQANYEIKELPLLPHREALQGADLLVIAGPQKDLQEPELQILRAWIKEGGKVFLMVDPFETPGLVSFAQEFGVILKDDIVIDQVSQFFGADLNMPIVSQYEPHPITEGFTLATFFPLVRSVTPRGEAPEGVSVETILKTSPESWAETDRKMLDEGKAGFEEGKDGKGPVPIGAAVTVKMAENTEKEGTAEVEAGLPLSDEAPSTKGGRLVILGDSDFASNSRINMVGNRDFFLNVVSWLAEETDLIAIRPRESGGSPPTPLTAAQQRMVFLLPVLIWPSLVLFAGVVVIKRRKRLK